MRHIYVTFLKRRCDIRHIHWGGGEVGILVHKFRISDKLTNGVRDETLPLANPLLHGHKGAHSISGSGTCVVSNILFCDFLTSTLTGHMPYEYFTLAFFLSVFFLFCKRLGE